MCEKESPCKTPTKNIKILPTRKHLSSLGHTSPPSDTHFLFRTHLIPQTPFLFLTHLSPLGHTSPRLYILLLTRTSPHSETPLTSPLSNTSLLPRTPLFIWTTSPHSYTPLLTQNLGSARDVFFINLSIKFFRLRFDIMIHENECYQTYTKTDLILWKLNLQIKHVKID